MKLMTKLLFFLVLVALSSSVQFKNVRKSKKLAKDATCVDKRIDDCDHGLICFPHIKTTGKDNTLIEFPITWSCKEEGTKLAENAFCLRKRIGSYCPGEQKCKDITKVQTAYYKADVGNCKGKRSTKRHSTVVTTTQKQKLDNVKKPAPPETPSTLITDEEDYTNLDDAYAQIFDIFQEDEFKAGYTILQYIVDKDEVKNVDVKNILEDYLGDDFRRKYPCKDVEFYLDLYGIKVVDLWTSDQRAKYDWMVNQNYLKGLTESASKAEDIHEAAEGAKSAASGLIGEVAGGAEVVGKAVSDLVKLAITTIVNKQLTNAMLEALKTYTPKATDPKKLKAAIQGGVSHLNEGIGILTGSFCQEIEANTGLKYLKKGSVKQG